MSYSALSVKQGEKLENSRIAARFGKLKSQDRAGLVTFTMAYDPDYQTSLDILKGLPKAGADIIELGMPFSDPMADGPAIQAAGIRALKNKATLAGILQMVVEFRKEEKDTPLILMGYYNPVYHYGLKKFVQDAVTAGVDGLIIVDLPPEEDDALFTLTSSAGIALIKLITPTTDEERLKTILPKASGFLYYVSVAGVTGTKSASTASIEAALARFKRHTGLPIVVGFGIKTPEQAATVGKITEAVVVGSALVQQVTAHVNNPVKAKEAVLSLVSDLAGGVQAS